MSYNNLKAPLDGAFYIITALTRQAADGGF